MDPARRQPQEMSRSGEYMEAALQCVTNSKQKVPSIRTGVQLAQVVNGGRKEEPKLHSFSRRMSDTMRANI